MANILYKCIDVKTERWVKKAKTVISTIPKHLFSQYRKNQVECTASANFLSCSICMEEHKDDDVIMELPCTHCFHEDCVTQWIQENNSCPNCKKKIVASPSK